ncbi:nitrogen fixation protein NifQ [Azospirillum sp. B4]|uniref:nitrogen fixation protein NifQ n=1 Tax=Azospirillum sp. B4 TaxID=95605 RepID=UPI00034A98A1|nr:nitrogen fixation protein NifQ [Azospirillum sp. B4]
MAARDPLSAWVGLGNDALGRLVTALFPGAPLALISTAGPPPILGDDEVAVRDLLWMYASAGTALQRDLSVMIARRCTRPNHLWQDLGLRDRGELSRLMERHFTGLKRRNSQDMKWKKFLYRMICRSEGFSLCSAPVCTDCDDFDACFGAEEGEAVLAHIRAGRELSP